MWSKFGTRFKLFSFLMLCFTFCAAILYSEVAAQDGNIYLPIVSSGNEGTEPVAPTDTPTSLPAETPTLIPANTPTPVPTDTPTEVPTATPTTVVEAPTEVLYDNLPSGENAFTIERPWDDTDITYFIANGTPDIGENGEDTAIRNAFALWSGNGSPLTFTEVDSEAAANIVVTWTASSAISGCSFGTQYGVLACASFPPHGSVFFDEGETWSVNLQPTDNQPIDLVTVAAHEIGHALGLGHTTAPGALMFPSYTGSQRALTADDQNGLRALYGETRSNAEFVVVWEDDNNEDNSYEIVGRGFRYSGQQAFADVTMHTVGAGDSSSAQRRKPTVAMEDNGNFVVAWEDDRDGNGFYQIYVGGFSASGEPRIAETVVNSDASGQQRNPVVAMEDNGNFVVVWEDDADDNGFYQILARGFNANGTERFSDIVVNTVSEGQQRNPDIAMEDNGKFVVVWEDDADDNGFSQILARGFNADGTERFSDILVNTVADGEQRNPSIAMEDNGKFVVAWEDDADGNEFYQILARGFNASGTERFSDILVNTVADGEQLEPDIAMEDNGNFVVVWEDDQDGNGIYQILARGFNANGTERFSDITVNTIADGQQSKPSVAMRSNGSFVVTWEDDSDGNGFYQILARGFDGDGEETIGFFEVNSNAAGQQRKPVVAMYSY